MPHFVTLAEYARIRNVSDRAARKWRRQGRLVVDLTGLVNVEASDALRMTLAERVRLHPPKQPPAPPPAPVRLVPEELLLAAGLPAAAELVAEQNMEPERAVLMAQGVLFHVASALERAGLYLDDALVISMKFNTGTDPGLVARVEAEAVALAAQWAAEDAGLLTP